MSDEKQEMFATLDVATIRWVTAQLHKEIALYPPTSPESIALWQFKEKLSG